MIRLSKEEKFQKYQRALQYNPPLLINSSVSPVDVLDSNPGKYVYMGDNGFSALFEDTACRLHYIEMGDLETFMSGLVFRKNFSHLGLFNEAIHRQFPYIQTIKQRYFDFKLKREECKIRAKETYDVPPLGLLTLLGCFCLLIIGAISSTIYFFIELYCTRRKRSELISSLNRIKCSNRTNSLDA